MRAAGLRRLVGLRRSARVNIKHTHTHKHTHFSPDNARSAAAAVTEHTEINMQNAGRGPLKGR